ncbi:MAG: hypothetical protein HFF84_06245 [Oscillibacter sp.]|nr:hypothetical protein [Oscillibacter sp.]
MEVYMPLIMFGLLIVLLVIGLPIVYALSLVALGTAFVLWGPAASMPSLPRPSVQ